MSPLASYNEAGLRFQNCRMDQSGFQLGEAQFNHWQFVLHAETKFCDGHLYKQENFDA